MPPEPRPMPPEPRPALAAAIARLRNNGRYPEPTCTAQLILDYRADLALVVAAAQETERLRGLYISFRQAVADLVYPTGGYGDGRTFDEICQPRRIDRAPRLRVGAVFRRAGQRAGG